MMPRLYKSPKKDWFIEFVFVAFLLFSLCITMLPFLWMAVKSFSPVEALPGVNESILNSGWSVESFKKLFEAGNILRFMINSMIHATGYTLLSLFLNSLAAYAFSRIIYPGRERIFTLLILTMMIPSQVIMIPVFLIVKSLGLLNSYLGLIIPGCAHAFGIFSMRQYMLDLPDELFEAARIDGCGDFDIYARIVLPLCKPILATLAVTSFVYTWDQFLFPLIIMQDETMFTLPVALVTFVSQHYGQWSMLLAGGLLTAIPSLAVFLIAQKAYVKGITAGASKS